ncbi:hypothetical protein M404DRAFT_1001789 [Pisolithus tinctorius Marx 270]|uniref:Uncharacterized protein n=1 Tax=Pisolithus tinctorius Marx 270 TaxID=870435 RepID=A0A0C3P701_PISTI|nr:hypothetical protein M404DRAFT_1001789 [Pisolithus tinctorius Marx 270]
MLVVEDSRLVLRTRVPQRLTSLWNLSHVFQCSATSTLHHLFQVAPLAHPSSETPG